MLIKTMINSAA